MEVKRPSSSTTSTAEKANSGSKTREFISDVKGEITKINWTSKEELIAYTKIVMIAAFTFGLGVYIVDLLIQSFLSGLSALIKLISG